MEYPPHCDPLSIPHGRARCSMNSSLVPSCLLAPTEPQDWPSVMRGNPLNGSITSNNNGPTLVCPDFWVVYPLARAACSTPTGPSTRSSTSMTCRTSTQRISGVPPAHRFSAQRWQSPPEPISSSRAIQSPPFRISIPPTTTPFAPCWRLAPKAYGAFGGAKKALQDCCGSQRAAGVTPLNKPTPSPHPLALTPSTRPSVSSWRRRASPSTPTHWKLASWDLTLGFPTP